MRCRSCLLLLTLVIAWGFPFSNGEADQGPSADPYRQGIVAFEQGRTDQALRWFEQAARLRPNDPRIANALGNAFFVLNRPKRAKAAYRRALRLDPQLGAARKNLGILEYNEGSFADAIPELRRATQLSPADAVAWRYLGLSVAGAGKKRDALAPLRRSLGLDGRNSLTRLALARAEVDAGEPEAARADFHLLVRDASLDARDQRLVGRALLELGDAEGAVDQLSFAQARLGSPDGDLDLALARAQALAHRPDDAVGTLEKALANAKDRSQIYSLLGWIEQQNHHPNQAVTAYRNSILADPKRSEAYLQLSWLYAEHRHFEEAAATLREGMRFVEDRYPVEVQLGTVLVLGGQENKAVGILQHAVAAEPHNALGYTTLIIAYTLLYPSYNRPLETAEAGLRMCPENYLIHYLYAGLLLREHRQDFGQPGSQAIVERIKSELAESIRLNPDFPHSHYDLARTEFDLGDYAVAEREARAALEADKDFSSARYLLGRVYLKQGRRQEGMAEITSVDREHREEMQRIQSVGQSLLAAQVAGMASRMPTSRANNETSK